MYRQMHTILFSSIAHHDASVWLLKVCIHFSFNFGAFNFCERSCSYWANTAVNNAANFHQKGPMITEFYHMPSPAVGPYLDLGLFLAFAPVR